MKTNEHPSDAAMQCALELLGIFGYPRDSYVEATVGRCVDRAIAAAVADATKELRDGLQTLAETSWTDTQDGSGDDLVVYRRFVKHSARALLQRHAPATSACPDAR